MKLNLKIELSSSIKAQTTRNKKLWNFVNKDIEILLKPVSFESGFAITQTPDFQFIIDHKPSNNRYVISSDLSFADKLELSHEDQTFLSLLLAVVIRLQHSYKGAFKVVCKAYSLVCKAQELLQETLQFKVTRNWLVGFIDCPTPGRKPIKAKPLTNIEIRRAAIHKKRAEGMQSISTWLSQAVKAELDECCRKADLNLEEALNKLIPIGIKTTCSVLYNFASSQKEPPIASIAALDANINGNS